SQTAEYSDIVRSRNVVVGPYAAEGRQLDCVAIVTAAAHDRDRAVLDAGWDRAREQAHDLLGRRVAGHVPVALADAEQRITHGSTHDHAVKAGAREGVQDREDRLGDRCPQHAGPSLTDVARWCEALGH